MIAVGVDLAWFGNDGCKRGKDRNGSKEKLGGGLAALYEVAEGIAHVHGLEAFIKGWLAKRL